MPDTTTPSPPPPTGAEPDLDASVEAMVSGARPTRARESARAGGEPEVGEPLIAPQSLDEALAETAHELAAAEDTGESSGGSGEDFDDFADPSAILGTETAPESVELQAPEVSAETAADPEPGVGAASPPHENVEPSAAEPEPVAVESGNGAFQDAASVLAEVSRELGTAPEQTEPAELTQSDEAAAEPPVPSPEPGKVAASADPEDADFQDAANVLAEASRELGPAPEQAAPAEQTQSEKALGDSPASSAEPEAAAAPPAAAEPEPIARQHEGPNGGIEELDHVLATDAENVLATAGDTPRIAASAVAPEDEVAAAQPAPVPAAPPPVQPPPPTPIAAPVAAPTSPPAPEAPREPKPKRSLRPVFAKVGALALAPLVRVNGRLSHTARQTIGYAAIITLFNCTWVWGYVLLRGPDMAAAPAGDGTRFVKPGDPEPHNDGGHGAKADAKQDGHGEASASKKEDGGHGSASKKAQKDDGHGSGAKAPSKPKKPTKKGAAGGAGHH